VLCVGRGEEAFEVQSGGYARYEGPGAVEEGKKAVPIDSKEEGMVGGEESAAKRERAAGIEICFVAKSREGQAHHGIGVREFGDEDELFRSGLREDVQKVGLEYRLESAFGGHPDGLGFEKAL